MKKLLPFLLFCCIGTHAQVLDAIAIDVDGEPITTLEIQAVQQKMNMSKQAAVEALIQDRLEKVALRDAGITIDAQELNAKIQEIAQAKGLTQSQMQNVLAQKGMTWKSYQEQLTTEMKKERFFKEHIMATITPPSDSELELYYNTHKEEFAMAPIQISLVAYTAQTANGLQRAIENPTENMSGVQQENILTSTAEMNPTLADIIKNTGVDQFTQIIKTEKGFISYLVKSKGAQKELGFEAVKNSVAMGWMQEQRVKAGQDFFNKLKSDANIRVIRL